MTTILQFKSRMTIGVRQAASLAPVAVLILGIGSTACQTTDYPQAEISNGLVTAKIYLPDAEDGFYRSTRFDWSGAIHSLTYEGHEFHGPWIDRIDPDIINWEFQGDEIVSGPCSALAGPVDEFVTPLGWDAAEPGGTFLLIEHRAPLGIEIVTLTLYVSVR